MSLILDALKKLEREKQTAPRGFLVVAPGAWAGRGWSASLVGGALLLGLVMGAVLLTAYGRMTQAAVPPPTAGGPAPAAVVPTQAPAPVAPAMPAPSPRVRTARNAPPATPPAGPADTSATPSAAPPALAEGPRLQAISEQDGHPVAVIDEQVMREGDEKDGMKVLRIGAAEVEIEHLGKRRILRF